MRRFAACLIPLLLSVVPAAAVPPPLVPPPPPEPVRALPSQYICYVVRPTPIGTFTVQQSISPDGVRDPLRIDSWATVLVPDGIAFHASWTHPAPTADSFVQISQQGLDPRRSYRIRVQREQPDEEMELLLQSPPRRPGPDGGLYIFSHWGAVTGMLADTTIAHILVIRDDGVVVRDDPIDPSLFARAVAAAPALHPALDEMVADYRNQCRFFDGGPIASPSYQVPGWM